MPKHSDVVNDALNKLYSYGRTDGRGRPKSVHGAYKAHDITPAYEPPDPKQQRPQDREDQHGPGYDNDAKGWVRGYGKPHPHFDSGPSGNRYRK